MGNLNLDTMLAEKQAEKATEQKEARPISERINDSGKLKIWHLCEQKYKEMWPVDAMGLLQTGQALLDQPEAVEVEVEVDQQEVKDDQPENAIEEIVPLSELTIPQLFDLAKNENLDLGDVKKKADIVEAIKAAREEKAGQGKDQE